MTQDIKHHLSENLLIAYAAGNLPEAFSLLIATHISMCDQCRAGLAAHEAVGGALIATSETAIVSDDLMARTMAALSAPTAPFIEAAHAVSTTPAVLQDYIGGDLDAVRWSSLGRGVRQCILKTDKAASARLLYIPAGQAVPDHGHRGTELTLVLQGAFADSKDRFGPGDVEIADEDLNHQPIAEMGDDCICLAVTDAPLRFNGLVPRILQPLFRI